MGAVALLLLAGCKEGKQQHCSRIRAIVTEEMAATSAFGKAMASGTIPYASYAVALRKASAATGAVVIQDAALLRAVGVYTESTAKLARAYEIEASAHDGSSATVGIIYGSMLDQSRISIANACPD